MVSSGSQALARLRAPHRQAWKPLFLEAPASRANEFVPTEDGRTKTGYTQKIFGTVTKTANLAAGVHRPNHGFTQGP
jgi:hypothetical protein